jgi:hypothetical protein
MEARAKPKWRWWACLDNPACFLRFEVIIARFSDAFPLSLRKLLFHILFNGGQMNEAPISFK